MEQFDPRTFDWREALKSIALAAAMGAAQGAAGAASMWRNRVCFVAGTPLLTPDGAKAIEDFRPGDLLLSRDEYDPEGAVEARAVEEVFVRHGQVMYLVVADRRIGTTAEHPFWVRGKGWLPAGEIIAGDHLLGHDGRWSVVSAVERTEEFQTVYNIKVSDFSTYFVGCDEWGFSVWAHNAACDKGMVRRAAHTAEIEPLRGYGVVKVRQVVDAYNQGKATKQDIKKAIRGYAKATDEQLEIMANALIHNTDDTVIQTRQQAQAEARQKASSQEHLKKYGQLEELDFANDAHMAAKPEQARNPAKWIDEHGGQILVGKDQDGDPVWIYADKDGRAVAYPKGFPAFEEAGLVLGKARLNPEFDGNHTSDYDKFNAALAQNKEGRTAPHDPETEVWHHVEDLHTGDLMLKKDHSLWTHVGGVAMKERGGR